MRSSQKQKNIFHHTLFFVILVILFHIISNKGFAQGLETLTGKVSTGLLDYFTAKKETNIKFSIIQFENFSDLSDLTVHKFYQQLVAKLEGQPQAYATYQDLMIDFSGRKGVFNLNQVERLDYLIYLKLIRNLDKIGIGIAIFSRTADKIVYIKYFEENFSAGERDIYETVDYGFSGLGFSRKIEINVDKYLLDCKSIDNSIGINDPDEGQYFFLYPGKIDIFKIQDNQFKKFNTIKLEWGRPYYPVMDYEGKLCFFYRQEEGNPGIYLTVGGNFSSYAKVLEFKNNQWQAIDTLDFIPIQAIRLNNSDYLAGGMYNEGRNYFKDQLILVPFAGGKLAKEYRLEKKLAPFYTLDFSSFAEPQQQEAGESRGNITGVHMIDTEYNNRFYAGDFQERTSLLEKRGSALAVLNGQWLAMSAYTFSKQEDKLFFYKIAEGSKQLIYENSLNGRVMFISAGSWQAQQGFWVYVEEMKNNTPSYRLQFWSKNIEKEGNNQG